MWLNANVSRIMYVWRAARCGRKAVRFFLQVASIAVRTTDVIPPARMIAMNPAAMIGTDSAVLVRQR